MNQRQDLFGPVIASYTRSDAIRDGVLVDVTEDAAAVGFRLAVALTAAAWAEAVAWDGGECQDETGRLWDVLWMASLAARRATSEAARFTVLRVPNVPGGGEAQTVELDLHVGPGDRGEAVVTILLPHED